MMYTDPFKVKKIRYSTGEEKNLFFLIFATNFDET